MASDSGTLNSSPPAGTHPQLHSAAYQPCLHGEPTGILISTRPTSNRSYSKLLLWFPVSTINISIPSSHSILESSSASKVSLRFILLFYSTATNSLLPLSSLAPEACNIVFPFHLLLQATSRCLMGSLPA